MVIAGLLGTLLGGFTATAWQKRNPAGYAWMLGFSVLLAAPLSFLALTSGDRLSAMTLLAASIFLLFLCAGPVNTLIIESVPINLRASAMALSIFMIHAFGDWWSPEIVGRLADRWGNDLQKGVLILPVALLVASGLWLTLAARIRKERPPATSA
jgi:sugar phosphate permease